MDKKTEGPSDRAIAQAFRKLVADPWIRASRQLASSIEARAAEIDATTPPAGARDAAADDLLARLTSNAIAADTNRMPAMAQCLRDARAALTGKADGECRYCGDTGYFYSEPEFGSCSCPLGKVTQPSEDRQDMKDRLLAALESSAAYQSALVAIGDLAASCADGNALAEALATIESISNHAIGREATQPAATGAGNVVLDGEEEENHHGQ